MALAIRVVKVGGSLFDWDELPHALWHWLAAQTRLPTLLVAGGGEPAEMVRRADARWHLGDQAAHRLALAAMRLNGQLLFELLAGPLGGPQLHYVQSSAKWQQLITEQATPIALADMDSLLGEAEQAVGRPLVPRTWEFTSDSLAAWLAGQLAADPALVDLVLLKSVDVSDCDPTVDLARRGYVDPFFPRQSAGLGSVRILNLRQTV